MHKIDLERVALLMLAPVYTPSGTMEVGVHIADVSHFVTGGTALDKFASQRATSVYLVQKVRQIIISNM